LSLELKQHPTALLAICDAARIREILCTLIDNAIDSTEHGSVTVAATRDGAFARLCVADAGPGLTREARAAVFDPDALADTAPLRHGSGLGIGLPLVRELVAAHDGEIVAESEGPGHGTRFIVGLRLAEAPFTPAPAAAGGLHPFRNLRVVLVDDSAEHLAALGAILTAEGARVESFDAPQAALERLRRGSVDLLISDLGMPEMDGYELITHVRRLPQLASLRAIALTGYGRTRGPGHAVRSGFDAHTTKPIALEELRNIVASLRPG
jgi:two-component system CheB/CheR fusion protein